MTKVGIKLEESKEKMNKTEMEEKENVRPEQPDEKKDLAQHAEDGVDGRLKGKNSAMSQSSQALLTENGGKKEEMKPIHKTKSKIFFGRFKYYFRHPYFRILIAYGVTFCNFFIYAEDPVAHSFSECTIPAIGNDFSFVANRYPPGGYAAAKVILYLTAIILAMIVGKLVIHRLLLRRVLKLSMFQSDQGSWMIIFFTGIISLFIFSFIYNAILGIKGAANAPYKISSKMGITNISFMKAAALGTWMGDFVTAWMVTDMMLQEKSKYPEWAEVARDWWNKGWVRVILFWTILLALTAIVSSAIISDYIKWDTLNQDFVYTSELGRGFLASFILVMDFTIVMQDWDFPMFESNMDIKLPGINTAYIRFEIPDCLRKEHWTVFISGKWFNYGILFMVMLLDLNMWKNQIFYKPFDYGQYVGPSGKVYSVKNTTFLATANKTTLSYAWRWSHPTANNSYGMSDTVVNSRYRGHSLSITGTAFVPTVITFIIFGVMIWLFGRNERANEVEALSMQSKSSLRRITGISITKEKDKVDGSGEPDADVNDGEVKPENANKLGADVRISYGSIENEKNEETVKEVFV